ncbi:hypothetical protein [Sagittula sp. S175]|uniref:hypothetical protein n=1 Tax=Sagittula sp. S175 TaxID=3415129 RepID=UPI003C7DA335
MTQRHRRHEFEVLRARLALIKERLAEMRCEVRPSEHFGDVSNTHFLISRTAELMALSKEVIEVSRLVSDLVSAERIYPRQAGQGANI